MFLLGFITISCGSAPNRFCWVKQIYNVGLLKMCHWSIPGGNLLLIETCNYVIQMCRKILDFLLLPFFVEYNHQCTCYFGCWTLRIGIGWACGAVICAAGATVYMGGAPAGVKTGAVYPCCTIGTATTVKREGENI